MELTKTPFYSQTWNHCGPAALATILVADGVDTSPESLADEVFLPARQGSLQAEIVAATRSSGRIPVDIEPNLQALVDIIAEGKPALVFLNLGIPAVPQWHYAVLVGYLPDSAEFVLRSGTTRRKRMGLRRFQHAWEWGGRWAIVAMTPGERLQSITHEAYESALLDLSETSHVEFTLAAFREAVTLFPESPLLWGGYGNAAWQAQDLPLSISAFRSFVRLDPENPGAHNNLAHTLLAAGCIDEARQHAERALTLAEAGDWRQQPAIVSTLVDIRQAGGDKESCLSPGVH